MSLSLRRAGRRPARLDNRNDNWREMRGGLTATTRTDKNLAASTYSALADGTEGGRESHFAPIVVLSVRDRLLRSFRFLTLCSISPSALAPFVRWHLRDIDSRLCPSRFEATQRPTSTFTIRRHRIQNYNKGRS